MTFQQPPAISPIAKNAKRQPFWSVMIPIYNPRLDYLEETLRCVLDQAPGRDQMQIEVVDDGSPNGVPVEFIQKIAGDRVAIHSEPRNLGLAGIWNRCVERAIGEWIHILHQDDVVLPGYYEALQRGIQAYPDVGAAYCRHAYSDENGHWHRLAILEMPSPGVLPRFVQPLVVEERVQCAAVAVRRTTYEQLGGFNPELKHALDWEMWIRIANKFSILYEPRILACWRNHPGAMTSRQTRNGEAVRDIAKAIGIWSAYLPDAEGQRLSEMARIRFAELGMWIARDSLNHNRLEDSLVQVDAALACNKSFPFRRQALKIRVKARAKLALRRWRNGYAPNKT
jgi:glycosyltransferase involved in cell wall biosynthesis